MWKSRRRNVSNLPLVAGIECLSDRVCLSALDIGGLEFNQETFEISGVVEMGDSEYAEVFVQFDLSSNSGIMVPVDENGQFSFPAEYTTPGSYGVQLRAESGTTHGEQTSFSYSIEQPSYSITDLSYADGEIIGLVKDESGAPPEDPNLVVFLDYSFNQDGSDGVQANLNIDGEFAINTSSFASPGENTVRLRVETGSANEDWVSFTFVVNPNNGGGGSGGGDGSGADRGFASSSRNGNDLDDFFSRGMPVV